MKKNRSLGSAAVEVAFEAGIDTAGSCSKSAQSAFAAAGPLVYQSRFFFGDCAPSAVLAGLVTVISDAVNITPM